MTGDPGLPGLPGTKGDYSFSGPQGDFGAPGKHSEIFEIYFGEIFFFTSYHQLSLLIYKYLIIFLGRTGMTGLQGIRGLDGLRGLPGDNGTTNIGALGRKGIDIFRITNKVMKLNVLNYNEIANISLIF